MNIVFLGPPGSGKGTQAKRLASELKLKHISTGDVFREAIGAQTELGKEIKSYVDNGKLVPDELVSRVVFEHLKQLSAASFLLDGYPRTVDQARDLDLFSQREKVAVDAVVFFDIESAELLKRLTARRQCRSCNEVFNLVTRVPKKEGVCDACGGQLFQRPDDTEEVIRKRLDVYERQTAPVLDHYRAHPGFVRVDAKQEIDAVFRDLIAHLPAPKSAH
jgi:adenylate kinase